MKKVDSILQKHAPLKKRCVRANQAPFIKTLTAYYERKLSSQ